MTLVEPQGAVQQLADIRYYLVWPTRRRKPFLDGAVLERTVELVSEAARALGAGVTAVSSGGDYLVVTVEAPPELSPLSIASHLKRHSAGKLRREFPKLAKLPSVWTRQYLATTGESYSPDRIRAFIDSQPRRDGRRYLAPGDAPARNGAPTSSVELRRLPPLERAT